VWDALRVTTRIGSAAVRAAVLLLVLLGLVCFVLGLLNERGLIITAHGRGTLWRNP